MDQMRVQIRMSEARGGRECLSGSGGSVVARGVLYSYEERAQC